MDPINFYHILDQAITPLALNIPEATEESLRSAFPGVELLSFYGTNETGLLSLGKTCQNIGELSQNIIMKVRPFLLRVSIYMTSQPKRRKTAFY